MPELNEGILKDFSSLFRGRTDAWGGVEGKCNREVVSIENYKDHLSGKTSLGIYPLLDDGSCYFLGIDIDIKDFNLALSLRNELAKYSIPSYIASSKSKGFHVYLFAQEKFIAKDIRRLLNHFLKELDIKAELFPKQNSLAPGSLGNYINIPAFGESRFFLSGDMREVPLNIALRKIKRVPQEAIIEALKTLPREKAREKKEEPENNLLAIEKILQNCSFIQSCRDNAKTLPEPFWFSMVHCLAVFGEEGEKKIHELSASYPHYTKTETNRKIEEAIKAGERGVGPHTCLFIEEQLGFNCSPDCPGKKLKAKSPASLGRMLVIQELYGPYLHHEKAGWCLDLPKLVNDLLTEYPFKTFRDNEECLIYRNGVYIPDGEATIKEESEKRVPKEFMTTHNINEVIGHIKRSTYIEREKFNREKWVLNLRNGLYNIQPGELTQHTPEFLSTIRIPIDYDHKAECPRIIQFFTEVLRKDDIQVIEELFGYCLIPDYSIQRAFLFTGEGANGKSSLLELLKNFLGKNNCSNLSLQAIENQRFSVAELFGKLANVHSDLPSTKMVYVGTFKMLVGGDSIGAERKFKDMFSFNNNARLVFSANRPPPVTEDTLAFWRRWIMLDFPNKFEGDKADKKILDKLTTKEELSGFLNIALQGLKRLLPRMEYSYKPTPDEVAERYQRSSDSVFAFVEDKCKSGPDFWVSKSDLYDAFVTYCDEQKLSRLGKEAFGRRLKNTTSVHVKASQRRIKGEQTWGWDGVGLLEEREGIEEDIDMEV